MDKYVLTKKNENHSLFKNAAFYENQNNEHAIYIYSHNELNHVIFNKDILNNETLFLKNSYDHDKDFKININDPARIYLSTKTCFFDIVNDNKLSYSNIYKTTIAHIFHGNVYTIEELKLFKQEQIKELILFSSTEQYNLICSNNSIHNDLVKKSLSLRYLLFLLDGRLDVDAADICNSFHSNFFDIKKFECLSNLKYIIDDSVFKPYSPEDLFYLALPNVNTPPTHEWLLAYYEHIYDYTDEWILFDFADYKNSPYSGIVFAADRHKLSEEHTQKLFDGLKTHILFTINSHLDMYKEKQQISDSELEYLFHFLNWIYIFDFETSIVISVFETLLDHKDYEPSEFWKRTISCEQINDICFSPNDLFDEWFVKLIFSDSPHIYAEDNIKYLIDNYADYLKNRKVPSKNTVVKHLLDEEGIHVNKFFFKKTERFADDIQNYDNSLALINKLI